MLSHFLLKLSAPQTLFFFSWGEKHLSMYKTHNTSSGQGTSYKLQEYIYTLKYSSYLCFPELPLNQRLKVQHFCVIIYKRLEGKSRVFYYLCESPQYPTKYYAHNGHSMNDTDGKNKYWTEVLSSNWITSANIFVNSTASLLKTVFNYIWW